MSGSRMMKAFFRSNEIKKRETFVKKSLLSQLLSTVQDIQLENQNKATITSNNESVTTLCAIIEAIFIHGVKETLVDQVSSAVFSDGRPEPDFWSPLMVYSHRDVIKQIMKLSQILTDIGRCRAWVRIALNEGLMISYLESIMRQNSALNPYYKKTAFLRDPEMVVPAIKMLEDISAFTFSLSVNSSVLNLWTNQPLIMAGIWSPPLKACPVPSGTDIANTWSLDEEVSVAEEQASLISYQESLSESNLLLDEEAALKLILGTPIQGSPMQSCSNLAKAEPSEVSEAAGSPKDSSSEILGGSARNSPVPREDLCISSSPPRSTDFVPSAESSDEPPTLPPAPPELKQERYKTYHSLLQNYNPSTSTLMQTADLEQVIENFNLKSVHSESPEDPTSPTSDHSGIQDLGFEILSPRTETPWPIEDLKKMTEHLVMGKIMQERGLLSQNFLCKTCKQMIGLSFNAAHVCAFTGDYYCSTCFAGEEWVIPSRIVQNWDFSKYIVSGQAASYLNDIYRHPVLDLRKLNPRLYLAIPEMSEIQKLRLRINILQGYLFTCRQPVEQQLMKYLWPNEYLYKHVHQYSVSDLLSIPSGEFQNLLHKVIKFSEDHVKACCLCSQKGFFCEVCNDSKIIYPFHLETTYRCPDCSNVFHLECRKKVSFCKKCLRLKERREAKLVESNELDSLPSS